MSTHCPLDRRLGYALKKAQHSLSRRMEEALRPLSLTSAQYAILSALRETPDQSNADLAEAAFLTPQSTQGVLAKLEAANFVKRTPDPNHGRRQQARLSDSGSAILRKADEQIAPIEAALANAIAPARAEDLLSILENVQNVMRSTTEE